MRPTPPPEQLFVRACNICSLYVRPGCTLLIRRPHIKVPYHITRAPTFSDANDPGTRTPLQPQTLDCYPSLVAIALKRTVENVMFTGMLTSVFAQCVAFLPHTADFGRKGERHSCVRAPLALEMRDRAAFAVLNLAAYLTCCRDREVAVPRYRSRWPTPSVVAE